ncbi:MAG: phosphoglucomutase [Parasphingorhabdus sp.]|jgi:phosphoglucomutase
MTIGNAQVLDKIRTIPTQPFDDQRPGTSGLRKKVVQFQSDNYLENFVQSVFDAIPEAQRDCLVVGGDGRYFNQAAAQTIIKMAAANGFNKVMVGQNALLSTPAVSNLIRGYNATGGIVLSASHNPGGPHHDFGIKFNNANGSPAPENVTEQIFSNTKSIQSFKIADIGAIELSHPGSQRVMQMELEVVDSVTDYLNTMQQCFDFDLLRDAFQSGELSVCFDAMHAVTGPYAQRILTETLAADASSLMNATPLEDFGGGHPDPNLVHARALFEKMSKPGAASLGAASDGDGDRNLILGPNIFVTPSDSLALITAHAHHIPQFSAGLSGVARSMPTSTAVDRVAKAMNLPCYETPTGWKYFGNLLDDGRINLCGEESFGTGGDHVREKDGLWTVLAWLSILAALKRPVAEIVHEHWHTYGRNFYCRHDFEEIPISQANELMGNLLQSLPQLCGSSCHGFEIEDAREFEYVDPVDQSISSNQGVQIFFKNGSRVVYRLSGTGTSGATLRMYVERFSEIGFDEDAIESNSMLAGAGAQIARIHHFTGREGATVVT